MRRFLLVPVLLAGVLGCASASAVPRPSSQSFVSWRNVLTGDEIRAHGFAGNAFEAIRSLRPWFLRSRTIRNQVPTVFIDGTLSHGLVALEGIQSQEIHEIRYVSEIDALSPHNGRAGVIRVTTWAR